MKDCGHCVISGFYLLKEVRNLDFNMSSNFFFPALIQTGLSATFKTVWHFFFQEALTSVLSPVTHLGTRSPHSNANKEEEGEWSRRHPIGDKDED